MHYKKWFCEGLSWVGAASIIAAIIYIIKQG